MDKNSRRLILAFGIATEGFLLGLTLVADLLFDLDLGLQFDIPVIHRGLYAIGPMIAVNFGIFILLARYRPYKPYRDFLEQVVFPLCRALSWREAVVLGLLAGFAEELFFRGALQQLCMFFSPPFIACFITAVLFAVMHFVGRVRHFWQIVLVYVLFGLYFSYLTLQPQGLETAIIAHGFYDILVILFIRYVELPHHPSPEELQARQERLTALEE